MIRCTCGAELFSIESICSACLPPKPPRALFVEDLRIKLANREEELLYWKETVELVNTENVELRAERDRLKAALVAIAVKAGTSECGGNYVAAVSLIGDLEQMADAALRAAGDGR